MSDAIHPLHATLTGSYGAFGLRVDVFREGNYGRRELLLEVDGCSPAFSAERNGFEELRIRSRHATITDVEHDASVLSEVVLLNPRLSGIWNGGAIEISGVIQEIAFYPTGQGPVDSTEPDVDGDCENAKAYLCEYEHCEPHEIGRYFPPRRPAITALAGLPAIVSFLIPKKEDDEADPE